MTRVATEDVPNPCPVCRHNVRAGRQCSSRVCVTLRGPRDNWPINERPAVPPLERWDVLASLPQVAPKHQRVIDASVDLEDD